MAPGGGLDVAATKHVSLRLGELDSASRVRQAKKALSKRGDSAEARKVDSRAKQTTDGRQVVSRYNGPGYQHPAFRPQESQN